MSSSTFKIFFTFIDLWSQYGYNIICLIKDQFESFYTSLNLTILLLNEVQMLLAKNCPRANKSRWKMGSSNKLFLIFFFLLLGSGWKSSNVSFLFSLRNPNNMQPFKCPIINGKNGNAIYCDPSYGAIFGGSNDLHIVNNANTDQNSYGNLGYTYQPPAGYQYNTQQTRSLFAGSYNFTPTEIEVFY